MKYKPSTTAKSLKFSTATTQTSCRPSIKQERTSKNYWPTASLRDKLASKTLRRSAGPTSKTSRRPLRKTNKLSSSATSPQRSCKSAPSTKAPPTAANSSSTCPSKIWTWPSSSSPRSGSRRRRTSSSSKSTPPPNSSKTCRPSSQWPKSRSCSASRTGSSTRSTLTRRASWRCSTRGR